MFGLPLRLLAFVQGAVALLTGERNLVRVRHYRFMWPVLVRRGCCGDGSMCVLFW